MSYLTCLAKVFHQFAVGIVIRGRGGGKDRDQRWLFCGEVFLSTCYLLIPYRPETEEEDAKDNWQQDEFHVIPWPWGHAAVSKQLR